MLQGFSHLKNIVHVIEFFKANGTAYMVMEFVYGETLKEYIARTGAMDFESRALPLMRPLMEDLNYLHESDVIHRDIAPDNIMITPEGGLKLIDFGCARSTSSEKLTQFIKPGYAPLEQRTTGGQGSWTDVYAFSATIYYCVTGGKNPVDSYDRFYNLQNGGADPLVPPSAVSGKISPENEQVLLRGLALQSDDRIRTMTELLAEFDKNAAPKPPVSPKPPVPPTGKTQQTYGTETPVRDGPVSGPSNDEPAPVTRQQAANDTLKVVVGILIAVVVVLVILVFVMATNRSVAAEPLIAAEAVKTAISGRIPI